MTTFVDRIGRICCRVQDRSVSMHTPHIGAVNDRLAPHSAAVIFVGSDAKFIVSVGFEVVDDCITGGACLIDPLPVPFPVADCVVPTSRFLYTMNGVGRTDRTVIYMVSRVVVAKIILPHKHL